MLEVGDKIILETDKGEQEGSILCVQEAKSREGKVFQIFVPKSNTVYIRNEEQLGFKLGNKFSVGDRVMSHISFTGVVTGYDAEGRVVCKSDRNVASSRQRYAYKETELELRPQKYQLRLNAVYKINGKTLYRVVGEKQAEEGRMLIEIDTGVRAWDLDKVSHTYSELEAMGIFSIECIAGK